MQGVDTLRATTQKFCCNWLFGFDQDMAILFLPYLVSISILWAAQGQYLLVAAVGGILLSELFPLIAWFHAGSSWFHYGDKDNRQYFSDSRKKFLIYFVMPAVIVIASIYSRFYCAALLTAVYMIWSRKTQAERPKLFQNLVCHLSRSNIIASLSK